MSNLKLRKLPLIVAGFATATAAAEPLRVCADPDNPPYSNRTGEGLDNAIAELVADELGHDGVSYVWMTQRGATIGTWLDAGACDVVMGVPAGTADVLTTAPYYRSMQFAARSDDPALVPASPAAGSVGAVSALAISMAVRRGDDALRAELDEVIVSHSGEIRAILERFGMPSGSDVTGTATLAGTGPPSAPAPPTALEAD